jgi:hypothetical protein
MTTELVLLLCVFAFVTAGAIFGDKGPFAVLQKSSPRLGARLEQNIAIGHEFRVRTDDGSQNRLEWKPPQGPAPTGKL